MSEQHDQVEVGIPDIEAPLRAFEALLARLATNPKTEIAAIIAVGLVFEQALTCTQAEDTDQIRKMVREIHDGSRK